MEGYIALHRKIIENELYFSEKFTKSQAWIDLLLLATHTDRTIYIRNIEIQLKAGDLCYSQLSLAERWKWNFKTVKKFLISLGKRNMVETKTNNLTTIISIKNWQIYQVSRNKTVDECLNNGEQNGEQMESRMETNNNVNNVNNIITKRKRKLRPLETLKKNSVKTEDAEVSYMDQAMLEVVAGEVAKAKGYNKPESSDFKFVNDLLKEKKKDSYEVDYFNNVRKCLMILYLINKHFDKFSKSEFKYPYFITVYSRYSYSNIKKEIFESKPNWKEIKPDINIIINPEINY